MKRKRLASEIIKVAVLPILDNQTNFSDLVKVQLSMDKQISAMFRSNPYRTFSNLFYLFEMIIVYTKHEEFSKAASKFVDLTSKHVAQYIVKALLKEILKKSQALKKAYDPERNEFVHNVFNIRLNWLSEQIKSKDKWSMPDASLPSHQRVENFLKSTEQRMLYSGNFTCTSDAREFISKYQGVKKHFSTKMEIEYAVGDLDIQKEVGVSIEKTEDYHDNFRNQFQNEHDVLKSKLNWTFY